MIFVVFDSKGDIRQCSRNWPMARSALDMLIAENNGCPQLKIYSDFLFCYLHPILADRWLR